MKTLLIAYDNDSFIHYFPLGLAYLASNLEKAGYEVEIYHQDQYHYPESHLTEYLDNHKFNMVGIGMCAGYFQYQKLIKLCKAIRDCKEWQWLVLGGHLVSPDPWYFRSVTMCDRIVVGEGETAILQAFPDTEIEKDFPFLKDFPILFGEPQDVNALPFPAWHLFDINYYSLIRLPHAENRDRCFPVLSSRGCPFQCNFCYRMHKGFRLRKIDSIVEEIQCLIKNDGITYVDFADELLMINPSRAIEISEAMKPLHLKWMCNGRLNHAQPKVLKAMKESGCVFINYGIESVDDEVLRQMNKKLTVKQIYEGVDATLKAGISPGLNMLWGNIGDTEQTLAKAVDFLLEKDDQAQLRTIRPVTPYPGCELYYKAIEQGKLKDCADFYENKHINSDLLTVNFTDLSDELFYEHLYRVNLSLINNYYLKTRESILSQAYKLYRDKDISFRGFRQT